MVSMIVGNKGSGKTKRLIALIHEAVVNSKGLVVCVEKVKKLTYDVDYRVRLMDTDSVGVTGFDAFYGFFAGICSCNYDVTDIFVDATLRIVGRDFEKLGQFMERISKLSEATNTNITFTISCDEHELTPETMEFARKI